jgi:predicted phosphoadenosine phosphosulfate sulfurtransferase
MASEMLNFATMSLASITAATPGAWVSWIGWIATAAFGVSYFAKTPKALRMVQACAALLWIAYGFIIHAMPVVVANAIVAGAAVYSSFAPTKAEPATETPRQF